jgi:elongation factor G
MNKMDRPGADFFASVESMKKRLAAKPVPIQIPLGKEETFEGVIDLITMKAIVYEVDTLGAEYTEMEIPDEYREQAEEWREKMVEVVVEADDELLEQYLAEKVIEVEALREGLHKGTCALQFTPCLCGSAFKNKGVQPLLDAIVTCLPSPLDVPPIQGINPDTEEQVERQASDSEPFSALIFKIVTDPFVGQLAFLRVYSGSLKAGSTAYISTQTRDERIGRLLKMHADKREEIKNVSSGDIAAAVGLKDVRTGDTICDKKHPVILEAMDFPAPVISVAIEPKTREDQDKLGFSMGKLMQEDPTFKVHVDPDTGQTIISGMGELHLEIIVDRLLREFGVGANVGKPQVAYKETITVPAKGEGKYVRQSGGRGQYGHVKIKIEPSEPGAGFVFEDNIRGGAIPREFISAVENGIKEAAESGVVAGYAMEDVRVDLYDGSYHEVDSSELAFKIAGSMAFKEAAKKAKPVILEPIMRVEVVVPQEYMGDVVGDLNGRRGRIGHMEARGDNQVIASVVPLAEMFGYATAARSLSQGRATYSMHFELYREVPGQVSEEIISRNQGKLVGKSG